MTPGSSNNQRASSGEDPDESLADNALSPTDGYFNALPPIPRDELIPDPEQENTQAAKEREAREAQEDRARRARRYATRQAAAEAAAATSSRRPHSPAGSSIISASSLRSVDTSPDDSDERTHERPRLPTYDDAIAQRPYVRPLTGSPPPQDHPGARLANSSAYSPILSGGYQTMESNLGQPYIQAQQSSNGHTTEPNDEARPLLASGGHDEEPDRPRGWLGRMKRRWPHKGYRRRGLLAKLLWFLLLVCVVVYIIKVIASAPSRGTVPQPEIPTEPKQPDDIEKARDFCHYTSALSWYFEYPEVDNISIVQIAGHSAWYRNPFNPRTEIKQKGEIRVVADLRPTRHGHQPGISTQLDLYASHGELTDLVQWQSSIESRSGLTLFQTPPPLEGKLGKLEDPCLYYVFWVHVPPGTNITRFEVGSEFLDVRFDSSFSLGSESKEIIAHAFDGDVFFPNTSAGIAGIPSRDIFISTDSGNIEGTFPLYDRLRMMTSSGNIEASIDLKEVDPYNMKPAVLQVESFSGRITVAEHAVYGLWSLLEGTSEDDGLARERSLTENARGGKGLGWVPARDYRTTISSLSGDLDAQLVHGSQTEVSGTSGDIKIELVPYGSDSSASTLSVKTTSSDIDFRLSRNMPEPHARIDQLSTTLQSSTGDLKVEMPDTWTGMVYGRIITGKIETDWPGLERTRSDHGGTFPFSRFEGHVGDGGSSLEFATVSGTVRLLGANKTNSLP